MAKAAWLRKYIEVEENSDRGRPRDDADGVVLERVTVRLHPESVVSARRIGHGNLSLGLRKMLKRDY